MRPGGARGGRSPGPQGGPRPPRRPLLGDDDRAPAGHLDAGLRATTGRLGAGRARRALRPRGGRRPRPRGPGHLPRRAQGAGPGADGGRGGRKPPRGRRAGAGWVHRPAARLGGQPARPPRALSGDRGPDRRHRPGDRPVDGSRRVRVSPAVPAFGGVTLLPVGGSAPEDVLVDPVGRVYTGLADGRIVRVDGPGAAVRTVATVPGRPLGLEFLGADELIVCASDAGLLAGCGHSPTGWPGARCWPATTRRSPPTAPSTSPTPRPATAFPSGA